jgi:2-hydroxychromene-2-carboxylate isomerase
MATTRGQTVELWYEFASTYSYLSVMRIDEAAARAGLAVRWQPFLLGPIFAAQGWHDSPFNIYPAKGAYMWRDLARRADARGIPLRRPSRFPRNGLLAARVATVAAAEGWCPAFTRAVFTANFAADREIGDAAVIRELLAALGLDADAVLARAQADGTKRALRAATDEALRRGVFGAPTFFAGGEMFWGDDRLEEALAWQAAPASPTASR